MRYASRRHLIGLLLVVAGALAACVTTVESGTPNYNLPALTRHESGGDVTAVQVVPSTSRAGCVRCGVARWSIKTLSDPRAAAVDFTPQMTTVHELEARPRPDGSPTQELSNTRYGPVELQTFTVQAWLVGLRLENDRDIVLALEDKDGLHTMRAEVPSPNCSGACVSQHRADFERVRSLLQRCSLPFARGGRPSNPIVVEVTGVGYFDAFHGQYAAASNGIELHPVLKLNWVSTPPC